MMPETWIWASYIDFTTGGLSDPCWIAATEVRPTDEYRKEGDKTGRVTQIQRSLLTGKGWIRVWEDVVWWNQEWER